MSRERDSVEAAQPLAAGEEKSTEQIRAEIDQTREEMGDTVAAVAAKTDVKAQAQAKVDEVKAQAKVKLDQARQAAPESPQDGFQQAQALAKENPKPVAIGAAVLALFALWRLLRS
jgi:ElaB/YqjD/DUF883 family membrane-anchored ribosome-binding protein